jgi:glucokinase
MDRKFVVVSGLPGSGKSCLAWRLASLVGLPVIDKDDILERLFELKGVGDGTWRRTLSRESDRLFRRDAEASAGAFLVSFWHSPGMSPDSGTPTDWLTELSNRIVHLWCECPAEVATARFSQRRRHPGHLDDTRSSEQILAGIRELARCRPLEIGRRVSVDTSAEIELGDLASRILRAFEHPDETS